MQPWAPPIRASRRARTRWRTTPVDGWMNETFDDSEWKQGFAPFGNNRGIAKTFWNGRNIWMRREFTLDDLNFKEPILKLQHDDDVKVYLNGDLIYDARCCAGKYLLLPMSNEMKSKLKKGKNIFAIHVLNTGGGAVLDVGIVEKAIPVNTQNILVAEQKRVNLNATQTIYQFTCGKVDLKLTFTSPLLINELDILARPVSYISAKVKSNDGMAHQVELSFGASTNISANTSSQEIVATKYVANNLNILKAGTTEQPILQKKGDDLRIDWGYMYVATPVGNNVKQSISDNSEPFQTGISDISKGKKLT